MNQSASPRSPKLSRAGLPGTATADKLRRKQQNGSTGSQSKVAKEDEIRELLRTSGRKANEVLYEKTGILGKKQTTATVDDQVSHRPDLELVRLTSKEARKKVINKEASYLLPYVDVRSKKGARVDFKHLKDPNSVNNRRKRRDPAFYSTVRSSFVAKQDTASLADKSPLPESGSETNQSDSESFVPQGEPAGVSVEEVRQLVLDDADFGDDTRRRSIGEGPDAPKSIAEATRVARKVRRNEEDVKERKEKALKSIPPLVLPRSGQAYQQKDPNLNIAFSARYVYGTQDAYSARLAESSRARIESKNRTTTEKDFQKPPSFPCAGKKASKLQMPLGSTSVSQARKPFFETHSSSPDTDNARHASKQPQPQRKPQHDKKKPVWQSPRMTNTRLQQLSNTIEKMQSNYRIDAHQTSRTDIGDLFQKNGIDIASYRLREMLRQQTKEIPSLENLSMKEAIRICLKHSQDWQERKDLLAMASMADVNVDENSRRGSIDLSHIKSSFALDQLIQRAKSDNNENGPSSNSKAAQLKESKQCFNRLAGSILSPIAASKVWKVHEHYLTGGPRQQTDNERDHGNEKRHTLPYKIADEYNISPRYSRKNLGFHVNPLALDPKGGPIEEYEKQLQGPPRSCTTTTLSSSARSRWSAYNVFKEELQASESRLNLVRSGKFLGDTPAVSESARQLTKTHSLSYAYIPENDRSPKMLEMPENSLMENDFPHDQQVIENRPGKGEVKVTNLTRKLSERLLDKSERDRNYEGNYPDICWLETEHDPEHFAELAFADVEEGGLGIVAGTKKGDDVERAGEHLLEQLNQQSSADDIPRGKTRHRRNSTFAQVQDAQGESMFYKGLHVTPRRNSVVANAYADTTEKVATRNYDENWQELDDDSTESRHSEDFSANVRRDGYYKHIASKFPHKTPSPDPYLPLTDRKPVPPPAQLSTQSWLYTRKSENEDIRVHKPQHAQANLESFETNANKSKAATMQHSSAEDGSHDKTKNDNNGEDDDFRKAFEEGYQRPLEEFSLYESQQRLEKLMRWWIQLRTQPIDTLELPTVPRGYFSAGNEVQPDNRYKSWLRSMNFDVPKETSFRGKQEDKIQHSPEPHKENDAKEKNLSNESHSSTHVPQNGESSLKTAHCKSPSGRRPQKVRDFLHLTKSTGAISCLPFAQALHCLDLSRLHRDLEGKKLEDLSTGDQFDAVQAIGEHRLARMLSAVNFDRDVAWKYKYEALSKMCEHFDLSREAREDLRLMRLGAELRRSHELQKKMSGCEWFNRLIEHLTNQQHPCEVSPAQRFIVLAAKDTLVSGQEINESFLEQILKVLSQDELLKPGVQLVLAYLRRISGVSLDTWTQMFTAFNMLPPVEALLQQKREEQRALGLDLPNKSARLGTKAKDSLVLPANRTSESSVQTINQDIPKVASQYQNVTSSGVTIPPLNLNFERAVYVSPFEADNTTSKVVRRRNWEEMKEDNLNQNSAVV